ncbi:uncharacterized protein [Palaemon carinicauda]|uniref:uncharacterized protein n=1 Tax=Palaemon carinicauda TaxID=392227 RepID=UPI0035B5E220
MGCGGEILNIISAYAPQVGCREVEKGNFWRNMDVVMQELEEHERIIVGADFNGHVVSENEAIEWWARNAAVLKRHGKELLGETSGIIWEEKESWWWSEEIEKVVKDKEAKKKKLEESQSREN